MSCWPLLHRSVCGLNLHSEFFLRVSLFSILSEEHTPSAEEDVKQKERQVSRPSDKTSLSRNEPSNLTPNVSQGGQRAAKIRITELQGRKPLLIRRVGRTGSLSSVAARSSVEQVMQTEGLRREKTCKTRG